MPRRAADRRKLALQGLRIVVHLLILAACVARGQGAARGADLLTQTLFVARGLHAEHFRAAGKIRKKLLALAHAEQGRNCVIAIVAKQIDALLRVFRDSGLLKAEGVPLGIVPIQRTDFLFIGNQQQFVHDASKAKPKIVLKPWTMFVLL